MARRNQRLELTWYNKDKALISAEEGKYKYRWVEPNDPRYCETRPIIISETIVGTQTPKDDKVEYSERADFIPTDDNLLVVGDSGDALEALTRIPEWSEKYLGRVKLVYIDPPFNTQNVFKDYDDNLEHSVWLTMMRDRLYHLKDLLAEDGTIWVHLDHQENHRMRLLLDEILGTGNFVADMVWQRKTSSQSDTSLISTDTDTITVYSKSKSAVRFNGLSRTAASEDAYGNPDNDPRGPWREGDYKMKSGSRYPIVHPHTGTEVYPPRGMNWRYSESTHRKNLADNRLYWGKTGDYTYPKFKRFRTEVADTRIPNNLLLADDVDTTRRAKDHISKLFPEQEEFDTPKPERLLERIIHIATNPGDIVMDVFGGSGTTAAVAHKMGRQWVTVELKPANVEKYLCPRLTKVVNNQDPGGVTQVHGYIAHPRTNVEIPEKNSAQDFRDATTLLNRVIKQEGLTDDMVETFKKAVKLLRTEKSAPVNWRGGGSFRIARLAPPCFDYDPERNVITLTPAATGETLVNAVAAQLKFMRTNDDAFDGRKGNARLIVVNGFVTNEIVDDLVAMLKLGETLALAATAIDDGVREHLRKERRGSVVYHVPDDLFHITDAMKGGDDLLHLADPDTLNSANAGNGDKK